MAGSAGGRKPLGARSAGDSSTALESAVESRGSARERRGRGGPTQLGGAGGGWDNQRTGSASGRQAPRRPLRVLGAAMLGVVGLLVGFLAISIHYGFAQTYGFYGYGGPLVIGLLAGAAAAAALCGAAVLLGWRRSVLAVGLVVLGAVTVAAVAASWLGGRSNDKGMQAAAVACDAPVGDYTAELGAAVGDVVLQTGDQVVSGIDGTCSVLVATSGEDARQLVGQAAEELGWREVGGLDRPTWSRGDVSASYRVDANDDKSANIVEIRAWQTGGPLTYRWGADPLRMFVGGQRPLGLSRVRPARG
jgi:hypothetical protein